MNDCRACKGPAYGTEHTCAVRTDPEYAQHLTDDAAAWLAERHNPKFKPRKPKHAFNSRPTTLTPKQRERAEAENAAWLEIAREKHRRAAA